MQGGELLGVVFGILLNRLLPQLVTITLSAVVLGLNSLLTLRKAAAKWKAESAAASNAKTEAPSAGEMASDTPTNFVEVDIKGNTALKERILAERARAFPPWAWLLLGVMCSFFVCYSLLIGGVFDSSFTNCLGAVYWATYLSPLLVYGLIMAFMARRNLREEDRMREAGLDPIAGDIRWSRKAIAWLIPAAIGAGIASGLLGIGGGMILGPIFVMLDFQPQVGTATTGFMILFTALGSSVKYLTLGRLPWRFLLWFGIIGAIGAQIGQRAVKRLILKTGRPSIIVFILGGVIAIAVVTMTTSGIIRNVQDANCGVDIWKPDTSMFVCTA